MARKNLAPAQGASNDVARSEDAATRKALVHKGLVLHFMLQLSLGEDADTRLSTRGMGRVHHRILYFAHFTPGIAVGELLEVLRVKHQNIQAALRQLVNDGYIATRPSPQDGRVKQLHCTTKGDKLLEFVSGGQRERIERGYETVTPEDIQAYFRVMAGMLSAERRDWVRRLTELDDPSSAV
jgi:DNA-binding MarR family transcriptional regulator